MTNLSLYEGRKYDTHLFLRVVCWVNVLFALGILFGWSHMAPVLAEPMSAAAGSALGRHSKPGYLEFPYVLLWAGPLLACYVAWITRRIGWKMFPRFAALYPLGVIALSVAWYHAGEAAWI